MRVIQQLVKLVRLSVVLMLVCGFAYSFVLTGLAQVVFIHQANTSLIVDEAGIPVASELVGQSFTEPYYLWGRPSAVDYNSVIEKQGVLVDGKGSQVLAPRSGSDNLAPTNPELLSDMKRAAERQITVGGNLTVASLGTDLVTQSASGLDPDITPQSAAVQVARIAQASGLSPEQIRTIIADHTTQPLFGFIGSERVNVVGVNLEIAHAMGHMS